jgi:hypothetical protein
MGQNFCALVPYSRCQAISKIVDLVVNTIEDADRDLEATLIEEGYAVPVTHNLCWVNGGNTPLPVSHVTAPSYKSYLLTRSGCSVYFGSDCLLIASIVRINVYASNKAIQRSLHGIVARVARAIASNAAIITSDNSISATEFFKGSGYDVVFDSDDHYDRPDELISVDENGFWESRGAYLLEVNTK